MWDQELTPGFWEYGCNTIAIQLEYHAIWRSAIIFFSRSASRFLERDCKSEGKCETLHLIPVHTIISTPLIQIKENGNLYELVNSLQTNKKSAGSHWTIFLITLKHQYLPISGPPPNWCAAKRDISNLNTNSFQSENHPINSPWLVNFATVL